MFDILKKIGLDPNLLQGSASLEQQWLDKYRNILGGLQNKGIQRRKMINEKKVIWSKKALEHRGRVILRGEGCNVSVVSP